MNVLEQGISRTDYICGDQFTAADVYVGSQIGWGMMFGTIDKRPAFEAYVARLRARPAARRASDLDGAAMPKVSRP
jgi:glutathione S-transferase